METTCSLCRVNKYTGYFVVPFRGSTLFLAVVAGAADGSVSPLVHEVKVKSLACFHPQASLGAQDMH